MIKKRTGLKIKTLATFSIFVLILTILSLSFASAVGVATSYWDDNPLKLAAGESTITSLRLQSDSGETTLRATMDSPIATLIEGPDYIVQPGTSVAVNISVKIPENAGVGTKYNIYVSFQEISSGEGGMVRVAQGVTGKIPVEVVGTQESALYGQKEGMGTSKILLTVLGVVVLIAVFFAIRKGKATE